MSGVQFDKLLTGSLREAVYLRKEDKIDEARDKLYEACAKNDPLALFYLGYAHEFGGFGIDHTLKTEAWNIYHKAAKLGNVWAMARLIIFNQNREDYSGRILESNDGYALGLCMRSSQDFPIKDGDLSERLLKQEAENDNPFAQIAIIEWNLDDEFESLRFLISAVVWRNESAIFSYFAYLTRLRDTKKSKEILALGTSQSVRSCLRHYLYGCSNKVDSVRYAIRIHPREMNTHDLMDITHRDLDAQYVVGGFLEKRLDFAIHFNVYFVAGATEFFKNTNRTCQKAVFAWLCISKAFLTRDVRRYIAEMVWKTRTQASIWMK